ncbi:MAG: glycosyltransferase [Atopobiaceae bacterium]|nr:glycosyltransferase [Atopobiaceae bacterium]
MIPRLTILMPSLNVAPYIDECLDSVLGQTLENIEVICIDAGSTDGTLVRLRDAEARDPRVKVIVSDQKSYGHQMNLGLDAASGEYIGIVETDDWVEPNMFERLYHAATAHQADVVKCNYYWYRTKPELEDEPFENLARCAYDSVFCPLESRTLFTTTPAIWSGIYRRDLLTENGIRFNETPGASYQDTSFHFMVCSCAKRAYLIKDALHHYRRDNDSSSVNSAGKIYCICDEMHYYEDFLDARPALKEGLASFYMALKYEKYRWNFDRLAPQFQWDFLKTMHDEFAQHESDGLLNRAFFDAETWADVQSLAHGPVTYFRDRCKAYVTRPTGAELPPAQVMHAATVENPVVSVIIPLYNCERTARSSIGSVLAQTHESLEVICVDDGSSDATLDILFSIAGTDPRVWVLHQENEGQSAARNHALDIARGTYVVFLDGDDALRSDALEHLVENAEHLDTEIIYFDGSSVFDTPVLKDKFPYYVHGYEYDLELPEPIDGIAYFNQAKRDIKYRVSACMALYKLAFLKDNEISFIDGIFHEDNAFTFECLLKASRVWHSTEQFYLRSVHDESTMTRTKSFAHLYGFLCCIERLEELIKTVPFEEEFQERAASELYSLITQLCNTYEVIDDQANLWKKLSEYEREQLNVILGYWETKKAQQGLNEAWQREHDIVNSVSFKVGRAITAPPRKARGALRMLHNHGPSYTWDRLVGRNPEWREEEPKALFVSSDAYRMSGAFLSLIALNKELNYSIGETTHVILPYYGSGNSLLDDAGIPSTVFPSKDWIVPIGADNDALRQQKYQEHTINMRAAIDIARFALDGGYNVIHSNTSYTYVGILAARLAGLPHVWHLREYLEEDQGNRFYDMGFAYRLLRESDRVVTISKSLKDKYAPIVGEDKIRVIYNGVDDKRFYDPEHRILQTDKPVFLFVSGSSSPFKGRADLVAACSILKSQGYDFELWFVGWHGHQLHEDVREHGLLPNTKFFGYQKETEAFYKQADIFFMCSRFEAFGRTTVEAGMGGCLVIGSDSAGTSELVEDGITGYLYTYGDAEGLAKVISRALDDREQSQRVAAEGRTHFFESFTALSNAHAIADLHKEVVATSRPHGTIGSKAARARIKLEAGHHRFRRDYLLPRADKEAKDKPTPAPLEASQDEPEAITASGGETSDVPKVSVVVPIYNVEDYLGQCLDSIVNQTLHDIEVICVNDASTDSSPAIIRHYMQRDSRIKLIDKANSGYGASVNRGIDAASGEYVTIVEPDDFILPDMYERLYGLARARGFVDIVKSSYWQYFDTEDGEGRMVEAPILSACHPPKDVFEVWDYPEIIYHHPSIWSCIYRRAFLKEANVRFVEAPGAGWVDNPFLIESFCKAASISWTPEAFYCYRQTNPNASSFVKDCSIPFKRTGEMLSFLDENGIYDSAIRESVYKRILYNAAAALENPHYDPERDGDLIRSQIRLVDVRFLSNPRVRDKEREAYRFFIMD